MCTHFSPGHQCFVYKYAAAGCGHAAVWQSSAGSLDDTSHKDKVLLPAWRRDGGCGGSSRCQIWLLHRGCCTAAGCHRDQCLVTCMVKNHDDMKEQVCIWIQVWIHVYRSTSYQDPDYLSLSRSRAVLTNNQLPSSSRTHIQACTLTPIHHHPPTTHMLPALSHCVAFSFFHVFSFFSFRFLRTGQTK